MCLRMKVKKTQTIWVFFSSSAVCFTAILYAVSSCSPPSHFTDSCRQLESARCEALAQCNNGVVGGVESCKSFYNVQCTRGPQDLVKEPLGEELTSCIQAIRSSCDVAQTPTRAPECGFLVANKPPVTPSPDSAAPLGDTSQIDSQ